MTHEQAFYLLKHFTVIDQQSFDQFRKHGYSEKEIEDQLKLIGSKFLASFCQSPLQLDTLLETKEPFEQIVQSNGRIASVYQFNQAVGTEQIVARNIVHQNDIFQLDRNGVILDAIKLDRLPLTKKIVVVRSSEGGWITAFPGNYAPAFPSSWMSASELELSMSFWKNHVFVTL